MNKLNFKLRILIYFAIAAIIPFLISWLSIYQIIDNKLQKDLADMNKMYVQNQINKIDEMFSQQENIIKSISEAYSYVFMGNNTYESISYEKTITDFLSQQIKINNQFRNLYIIMNDGKVYVDDRNVSIPDMDLTHTHLYINAKKSNELVWLEPYTDVISSERCIGISLPLSDSAGNEKGVLIGTMTIESFGKMLAGAKYMPDVRMILINKEGYVKYDSEDKYSDSVNISDSSFILNSVYKDLQHQSEGSHEVAYENKNWFCIFSSIKSNNWKVVSLLDTDRFRNSVGSLNKGIYDYFTLLAVLAVFLAAGFATVLSGSITKPLLKLRDGAKALSLGHLNYKMEVVGHDEISELATAFNEMSSNLQKTYDELFNRTNELFDNNKYLQEINAELEASYQQLGAAMSQLNESEEKYRKLMSNISDMILVVNTDNEIMYINSKLQSVLGYGESELIGRSVSVLFGGSSDKNPFEAALIQKYIEYQHEMIKKDGSSITIEGSAQAIEEDGIITGIQAIARDITQRKLMEQQLAKRYNELQVLNRVNRAIANTLDLKVILHTIVNQVIDITDALVCSIRLKEMESDDILILNAIEGIRISNFNVEDIVISKELMGRITARKQSLSLELILEELPNDYLKQLYLSENARFVVFNPLVVQGNTIGVMTTITRSKPSYEQTELITSLANGVALAIDNAKAYEHLKHSYLKTVQSLISAVEAKDVYTESHSIRVAKYSCFIAAEMGFSKSFIEDIWVAGVLHDIGKIGISDSILNKKEKLTVEEYELIKQHPGISHKIISKIGLKSEILEAVKYHHERYDGKGYPEGLQGSNISVMAAIISIADAFDAITSERSYKKAKSIRQGINEIVINRGMQFDPKVVDVFERAFLMKSQIIEKIYNNDEVNFF
ncbi:MAG: HD domain-containing phosphohydrolase [Bacillota bacterium]